MAMHLAQNTAAQSLQMGLDGLVLPVVVPLLGTTFRHAADLALIIIASNTSAVGEKRFRSERVVWNRFDEGHFFALQLKPLPARLWRGPRREKGRCVQRGIQKVLPLLNVPRPSWRVIC